MLPGGTYQGGYAVSRYKVTGVTTTAGGRNYLARNTVYIEAGVISLSGYCAKEIHLSIGLHGLVVSDP